MRTSENRIVRSLVVASFLVALVPMSAAARPAPKTPAAPPLDETVQRLLGVALASNEAYEQLEELCDRIGPRLSGTVNLDRAIAWAQAKMKAAGFENVRAEPVMVPVWRRGEERARLIAPVEHPLSLLALGGSVGTPAGGITADVVVVENFEQLAKLGDAGVRGRIVLFDVPYTTYGETVRYRSAGAVAAAQLGAVAALVRSVGPISYDTPHTGALSYKPEAPKIPAAALSIEDAMMLGRLYRRGASPRVHLSLGATTLADAPSANVVGELRGRERPDEIVLLGAHLDSWDVGTGAQDDGAGVMEMMGAVAIIKRLGLAPRRTLRVVLFTNEENGLRGGRAYKAAHEAELAKHVAVVESDSGAGPILGMNLDVRAVAPAAPAVPAAPAASQQSNAALQQATAPPKPADAEAALAARSKELVAAAVERAKKIAPYLEPLDATLVRASHAGADLEPMLAAGVLGIGVEHDSSHYFDVHHTHADTFEKIDKKTFRRNVAAVTLMAWLLAEAF